MRDGHAIWCCVEHPGTACGDQCPACGQPLDIDNERCVCGYDARNKASDNDSRPAAWVTTDPVVFGSDVRASSGFTPGDQKP